MSSFAEPLRSRCRFAPCPRGRARRRIGRLQQRFFPDDRESLGFQAAGSNEVTGSVRPQAAPTHKVETSALPPPTYGGSAGIGTHQPPARQDVTGSVSAAAAPAGAELELGRRHRDHRRAGRDHRHDFAPSWRAGRRDHAGEQHDACGAASARPAAGDPARAASDERMRRRSSPPATRVAGPAHDAGQQQRARRQAGRDDLFARAPLSASPRWRSRRPTMSASIIA